MDSPEGLHPLNTARFHDKPAPGSTGFTTAFTVPTPFKYIYLKFKFQWF